MDAWAQTMTSGHKHVHTTPYKLEEKLRPKITQKERKYQM